MRTHVRSSLGVDTPVPATEQPIETVSNPSPKRATPTQQTLAIMGLSGVVWAPVAAGAWIGGKYDSKGWGALAGFAVSFLVIRSAAKAMSGAS